MRKQMDIASIVNRRVRLMGVSVPSLDSLHRESTVSDSVVLCVIFIKKQLQQSIKYHLPLHIVEIIDFSQFCKHTCASSYNVSVVNHCSELCYSISVHIIMLSFYHQEYLYTRLQIHEEHCVHCTFFLLPSNPCTIVQPCSSVNKTFTLSCHTRYVPFISTGWSHSSHDGQSERS